MYLVLFFSVVYLFLIFMCTHYDNEKQNKEKNIDIYELLAVMWYSGEEFWFCHSSSWTYILVSTYWLCELMKVTMSLFFHL